MVVPEMQIVVNKIIIIIIQVSCWPFIWHWTVYRLVVSHPSTALISIKKSETRQDIVWEMAHMLQGIRTTGVEVKFIWVPAHSSIEGNEMGSYAKSAMRKEQITMGVMCIKAEIKSIVQSEMKRSWQRHLWHRNTIWEIVNSVGWWKWWRTCLYHCSG